MRRLVWKLGNTGLERLRDQDISFIHRTRAIGSRLPP
jgi:hypothetical protein